MMEKYYKIIQYKGKNYLFNILTFVTKIINEPHDLIAFEKETLLFEELEESIKEILRKDKFIRLTPLNIQEEQDNFNLVSFSFPPIHECNLRCTYCFANHGENFVGENRTFTDDLVEKLCNFIIDNYSTTKNFRLDFVSGGESLLNSKKTIHFIELAKSIFKNREKNLFVWLCTNGTTITNSDAKALDTLGVRLGISIDGNKTIHDAVRPFVNGKGSYEVLINNVKQILEDKDLSKQFRHVWCCSAN